MFYPNRLVSDLVFCVAENSEYLDMHCFPRLEYEAISRAIPDKTFFCAPNRTVSTAQELLWDKI